MVVHTNKGDVTHNSIKAKMMKTKPSRLHDEIIAYAAELTPTDGEQEQCDKVIELIRKICYETFGTQAQVIPFGSYANGLATSLSDVDIVICGLLWPETPEGFFGDKHVYAIQFLQILEEKLQGTPELQITQMKLIQHAKVPLLKFTTKEGVMVDLSINDDNGPRAARYILEKVRRYPSLRPLALVLKAFLKAYHVSEVQDGGLGGFALANIIVAHIQETMKAGQPTCDLGELLMSFFNRYAHIFNPEEQAVSVFRGGIVGRSWVTNRAYCGKRGKHSRSTKVNVGHQYSPVFGEQWVIENPITGMNVAQGSFNIYLVRELFSSAYWTLHSVMATPQQKTSISPLGLLFSRVVDS